MSATPPPRRCLPPRRRRRLWLAVVGGVVAATLLSTGTASAQSASSKEYQIKAVFLLNFASFAEWPPSAFAQPDSPIVIGVLGTDPFGGALAEAVSGEKVQQHPVVLRYASHAAELRGCHIVFICQSERRRLADDLEAFGNRPVLTVSDIPGFARDGGMIGFVLEANRVRFEINPARAGEHGLKLSSQLLALARIVENPTP